MKPNIYSEEVTDELPESITKEDRKGYGDISRQALVDKLVQRDKDIDILLAEILRLAGLTIGNVWHV